MYEIKRYEIAHGYIKENEMGSFCLASDVAAINSVLQDWVMRLPLRHQGSLVAALRGSDTDPKHGLAKPINRSLRRVCMNPADERECSVPGAYMSHDPETFPRDVKTFADNMDNYPLHFVTHIMHACEIVGYRHPDNTISIQFRDAYYLFCHRLHVMPELPHEMQARLTKDRVADNTVVD